MLGRDRRRHDGCAGDLRPVRVCRVRRGGSSRTSGDVAQNLAGGFAVNGHRVGDRHGLTGLKCAGPDEVVLGDSRGPRVDLEAVDRGDDVVVVLRVVKTTGEVALG